MIAETGVSPIYQVRDRLFLYSSWRKLSCCNSKNQKPVTNALALWFIITLLSIYRICGFCTIHGILHFRLGRWAVVCHSLLLVQTHFFSLGGRRLCKANGGGLVETWNQQEDVQERHTLEEQPSEDMGAKGIQKVDVKRRWACLFHFLFQLSCFFIHGVHGRLNVRHEFLFSWYHSYIGGGVSERSLFSLRIVGFPISTACHSIYSSCLFRFLPMPCIISLSLLTRPCMVPIGFLISFWRGTSQDI